MLGSRRTQLVLVAAMLALAAVLFCVRGLGRGFGEEQTDFSGAYVSARAWMHGLPPYRPSSTQAAIREASDGRMESTTPPVYPPCSLPVLMPWAVMPWESAFRWWLICSAGVYLWAVSAVGRWVGLRGAIPWMLFLAAALAFAPAHTGLRLGNPGVLSGSLAVLALAAAAGAGEGRARAVAAGLLMGVAVALKPHLALPAWACLAVTRRMVAAGIGLALPAALMAAAAWDLAALNPEWPRELADQIAGMEGVVLAGDSFERFGVVQLTMLVHFFVDDPFVAHGIGLAFLGVPAAFWAARVWRDAPGWRAAGDARVEALASVAPLALGLLATYHRPYDLVILLPAIGWMVWSLSERKRGGGAPVHALWMAAFLAPFIAVPWAELLKRAVRWGWLSTDWVSSDLFQFFVMAHPTWLLLGIGAVAVHATCRRGSTTPGGS